MVVVCAVEIFGDIHVFDPHLPVVDVTKGIDQRGFPLAYRFYLRAGQYESGGEGVADGVVECRTAVFYVDFLEFHRRQKALMVDLLQVRQEYGKGNSGHRRHRGLRQTPSA